MFENWPSFDQLMKIAERSPEELEKFRQKEVAALIESAPIEYRRRLKGLQFQIDCARQKHQSPLGACISISKMMHESVGRLNAALHGEEHRESSKEKEEGTASVIPFPATSC